MKRSLFCCALLFTVFSANASNNDFYENDVKPRLLQLKEDLKFSKNTAIKLKDEILWCIEKKEKDQNLFSDLIRELEKITPNIFKEGTAVKLVRMTIYSKIGSFMEKEENRDKFLDKISSAEKSNRSKNFNFFGSEEGKPFDYMN